MRVLSMFDGISCGRVALERVGITPEVYYASEIDKYAEQVSADNYPDIVRLGDAYKVDEWELGEIDLLLGGSPCTYWSVARNNRETESSGLGWELFSLYVKALKRYKPRYFLYENVQSMSAAIREEITKALGVEPISINSALVSAQNRERLYWTNIPGVERPADKGIFLKDILESGYPLREKGYAIKANYDKGITAQQAVDAGHFPANAVAEPIGVGYRNRREADGKLYRRFETHGQKKSNALTTHEADSMVAIPADGPTGAAWRGRDGGSRYEARKDGKANALTAAGHQSQLVAEKTKGEGYSVEGGKITIRGRQYPINLADGDYLIRKFTVTESCRLQTLPDNYCKAVSPARAYKAIGNGWTVDVIAHILGYINKSRGESHTMKSLILTAQDARDLESVGGLTITKPIKEIPAFVAGFELRPMVSDVEGVLKYYLDNGLGPCGEYAAPVTPGDVVFIREPWYRLKNPSGGESDRVILAGDSSVGEDQVAYKWASPVSMPEAAARRFARVVSVAPLYNESVAVWEIVLEKIDKAAAEAAEADEPPIASEADDPENVSDYLTYAGDMSPEDHERMIAKIDADRARLSEVRERLAKNAARRAEIKETIARPVTNPPTVDEISLDAEDRVLVDEETRLQAEEAELVEALTAAGVPVDDPEAPEETETAEEPAEGETAAESAGDAPEDDEEIGSFLFGKCKYCGREWGVTLEGAKGGGYPTQRTANAAATRLCDCPEAVEKRTPIVGVAIAVTRGVCGYCGQYIEVGPHPSQAAADETASEVCSCYEARKARRINEQIEDAREKVSRLFGEEAESLGFKPIAGDGAIELLEEIVGLIARGPVTSATVNVRGQCKAKFSITSKGKIKVSRSETRSCDLEAGE